MSRRPIDREPSLTICDGRDEVGFIFDTKTGCVATLANRIPLGEKSPDRIEAREAIRDALRQRREAEHV